MVGGTGFNATQRLIKRSSMLCVINDQMRGHLHNGLPDDLYTTRIVIFSR
jgi:hypothetical protein